ncbi:MAG: HAD family phosphatase [Varibaculum sp.]|nr:HAD family phosphatase [Varibaculum sp.]
MIRAAVFDVDGTLLDSLGVWPDAGEELLSRYGKTPKPELYDDFFTVTLPEGARMLREVYELQPEPDELAAEMIQIVRRHYAQQVPLKPGAAGFLAALQEHDIPMAIVSSGTEHLIRQAFDRLDITKYFQHIYGASDLGRNKRNPGLFLQAAESLAAKPADTWVFEDALYAIQVVKSAGFHTVGISDGHSAAEQHIRDVADLFWEEYPAEIPPQMMR